MELMIEFYKSGEGNIITALRAHASPDVGEKVDILGQSWVVKSRSWCVDYSDMHPDNRQLRVCLNCEPTDRSLDG